jgi:hypothetical protein
MEIFKNIKIKIIENSLDFKALSKRVTRGEEYNINYDVIAYRLFKNKKLIDSLDLMDILPSLIRHPWLLWLISEKKSFDEYKMMCSKLLTLIDGADKQTVHFIEILKSVIDYNDVPSNLLFFHYFIGFRFNKDCTDISYLKLCNYIKDHGISASKNKYILLVNLNFNNECENSIFDYSHVLNNNKSNIINEETVIPFIKRLPANNKLIKSNERVKIIEIDEILSFITSPKEIHSTIGETWESKIKASRSTLINALTENLANQISSEIDGGSIQQQHEPEYLVVLSYSDNLFTIAYYNNELLNKNEKDLFVEGKLFTLNISEDMFFHYLEIDYYKLVKLNTRITTIDEQKNIVTKLKIFANSVWNDGFENNKDVLVRKLCEESILINETDKKLFRMYVEGIKILYPFNKIAVIDFVTSYIYPSSDTFN